MTNLPSVSLPGYTVSDAEKMLTSGYSTSELEALGAQLTWVSPDPVTNGQAGTYVTRHREFVQNIEDTLHRTQELQKKITDVLRFTALLDGSNLKKSDGTPLKKMRPEWEKIDKAYQKCLSDSVDLAIDGKDAARVFFEDVLPFLQNGVQGDQGRAHLDWFEKEMLQEADSGEKLVERFKTLSRNVYIFADSLKIEFNGVSLTDQLQKSAHFCLQEIEALRSKLDWHTENLQWSLGIASGGVLLLASGIAIGCCGGGLLLAGGVAAAGGATAIGGVIARNYNSGRAGGIRQMVQPKEKEHHNQTQLLNEFPSDGDIESLFSDIEHHLDINNSIFIALKADCRLARRRITRVSGINMRLETRDSHIEGLIQCYRSLIIALDKYVVGAQKGSRAGAKEKSG